MICAANSCFNTTYICKSENCEIICESSSAGPSCKSMTIIANTPSLNIVCDGVNGCNGITIDVNITNGGDNAVSLACSDTNSCSGMNLNAYSERGGSVEINCADGADTPCINASITCNIRGECGINCENDKTSCADITLYCGPKVAECTTNDQSDGVAIITSEQTPSPTVDILARYAISINLAQAAADWYKAEEDCMETYNGHLATIITDEDLEFAKELLGGGDAWIGLNNIVGTGWHWIDGASCNGLCEDDPRWNNKTDFDGAGVVGDCGSLEANGKSFIPAPCDSKKTYLCNILPIVDYICVNDQDTSNWIDVIKYDYFYECSSFDESNSSYALQWNNSDSSWNLIIENNPAELYCIGDKFVLP